MNVQNCRTCRYYVSQVCQREYGDILGLHMEKGGVFPATGKSGWCMLWKLYNMEADLNTRQDTAEHRL